MIAAYMRLSMADENIGEDEESNSIRNQRVMIRDFINDSDDLKDDEVEEFIDDGFSGTNTNRPAFQKMIEYVKSGEITTIVVKDFSRFSRDYIESGEYIDRIFPFMGIRFIAINDHYDSGIDNEDVADDLERAIKNIINNSYSLDLSMKLSASHKLRRDHMQYTGAHPCYGFLKDPKDIHNIVIDPVASAYVRKVFEYAMEEKLPKDVAARLNVEKIPTPMQYKYQTGQFRKESKKLAGQKLLWNGGLVRKILMNEKYKGTYVANERSQIRPCCNKRKWNKTGVIRVDNQYPAIVTAEEFKRANLILHKQPETGITDNGFSDLRGKLVCAGCGKLLAAHKSVYGEYSFSCRNRNVQAGTYCVKTNVQEADIKAILRNGLNQYTALFERVMDYLDKKNEEMLTIRTSLDDEEKDIMTKLSALSRKKVSLYEDYAEERLEKEQFVREKKVFVEDETKLQDRLLEIRQDEKQLAAGRYRNYEKMRAQSVKAKQGKNAFGISYKLVGELINRIKVISAEEIEIEWKFGDEIQKVMIDALKESYGIIVSDGCIIDSDNAAPAAIVV